MVRGSRAVGVSWDMGMAQGLRVGVWEGSEMVYCTTAASHLNPFSLTFPQELQCGMTPAE